MPAKLACMHTAEHILMAVMRKFYDAPRNLEFHLNEKKTKCDYEIPRSLNEQDITQIETLVNQEINANHSVSYFLVHREEAKEYDLWKVPAETQEIRDASPLALWRLPAPSSGRNLVRRMCRRTASNRSLRLPSLKNDTCRQLSMLPSQYQVL